MPKKSELIKYPGPPPALLSKPDLSGLRVMLEKEVARHAEEGYAVDSDQEHYIYEEVMQSFFGRNYYDWHNAMGRWHETDPRDRETQNLKDRVAELEAEVARLRAKK